MIKLANILHFKGFYITLILSEFNFSRLSSSLGSKFRSLQSINDFRIETISDGLPLESDRGVLEASKMTLSFQEDERKRPIRDLLIKLLNSPNIPQISYIISDIFMFVLEFGKELGIPVLGFSPIGASALLGLMTFDEELVKRGYFHCKDGECYLTNGRSLNEPIDWVPGLTKSTTLKHLLAFMPIPNEQTFNYFATTARNLLLFNGLIWNTFDHLESQALESIKSKIPNLYAIGPLSLLCQELNNNGQEHLPLALSLWKEDNDCLIWLNNKSPKSVIYVNFGSLAIITLDQLREFAWGLANSNVFFLWVIRSDLVEGGISSIITNDYMKEIEGRGLIISWCSQEKVLKHPSISVFLTHCGWNSVVDSICEGVPMICWPRFFDQQIICLYACKEWRIAMEIEEFEVKRDMIEELVKEMVEGERGKELQRNALEWKKRAKEGTRFGGSSYNDFDKLVNQLMKREIHCLSA